MSLSRAFSSTVQALAAADAENRAQAQFALRARESALKNAILEYGFRQQQARDAELGRIAQGMRPEQQQFSPEELAQIERLKPIAQTTPASEPMTDAQRMQAFAQQYNPAMRAQQPTEPQVGPPEPALPGIDQASVDVAGPEMLQQVGFAYLRHGKGEQGLQLLRVADSMRKSKEMAGFYRSILASGDRKSPVYQGAVAGLGSLLMEMGKEDQALELLKSTMPPSVMEIIEKVSADRRSYILSDIQQGKAPKIAGAPKQARRVKTALAEAEAHAAQPPQTAGDAGITTTASGERVRAIQQLHGSR